jgi:hypothetical protein
MNALGNKEVTGAVGWKSDYLEGATGSAQSLSRRP